MYYPSSSLIISSMIVLENIQLIYITIRYKSSDPKQGHLQKIVNQSEHDAYISCD